MRSVIALIVTMVTIPAAADDLPQFVQDACSEQCAPEPPTPDPLEGEDHTVNLQVPSGIQYGELVNENTLRVTVYMDGESRAHVAVIPLVSGHSYTPGDVEGISGDKCEPTKLVSSMHQYFDLAEMHSTPTEWEEVDLPGVYGEGSQTCTIAEIAPPRFYGDSHFDGSPVLRAGAPPRVPHFTCTCEDWWATQGLETPAPEQLPDTYTLTLSYVTSDQLTSAE